MRNSYFQENKICFFCFQNFNECNGASVNLTSSSWYPFSALVEQIDGRNVIARDPIKVMLHLMIGA